MSAKWNSSEPIVGCGGLMWVGTVSRKRLVLLHAVWPSLRDLSPNRSRALIVLLWAAGEPTQRTMGQFRPFDDRFEASEGSELVSTHITTPLSKDVFKFEILAAY